MNKIQGNLIDKINRLKFIIFLFLGIIIGILYKYKIIYSPRSGVSDTITVSSIILATAGVFIGLLVGEAKNSEFFKLANKVNKGKSIFNTLLFQIRNLFIENIIFILITLSIDFVKNIKIIIFKVNFSNILKFLIVVVWTYLLLLSLWDIFYVVDCITKIMSTKNNTDGTTKY